MSRAAQSPHPKINFGAGRLEEVCAVVVGLSLIVVLVLRPPFSLAT